MINFVAFWVHLSIFQKNIHAACLMWITFHLKRELLNGIWWSQLLSTSGGVVRNCSNEFSVMSSLQAPKIPPDLNLNLNQKLILYHSATCIDNIHFYEKYLFLNYNSQAISRNNCFCPNFSAPTKMNMKEENFLSSFFTQCLA